MEPERQIEKLLRAVAKKRRDQAGDALELRPSAREQLQREAARHAASKSGGGFFSSLFSTFTPKLAFGLCVLAFAAVAAWLLLPGLAGKHKESTLAMNEQDLGKAAPGARREVASPPPASPAPVVAANKPSSAPAAQISPPAEARADRDRIVAAAKKFEEPASAGGIVAQTAPAPATPAPSAVPSTAPATLFDATPPSGSFGNSAARDKDVTSKTFGAAAPTLAKKEAVSGPAVAAAEPPAQKKPGAPQTQAFFRANQTVASDGLLNYKAGTATASNSQRFHRTAVATTPHAAETPNLSPVLTSFQVVQNGHEIRVVDADGSIYTGSFTTPAEASVATTQNYFFRVTGTNHNLNQNIIFSGTLIPLANVPQAQTSAISGGGGAGARPEIPDTSLLLNSRIAGKAIIGGQKEIEVNATPAH